MMPKNILVTWPTRNQGGGYTVFRDRLRLLSRLGWDIHVLTTQPLESQVRDSVTFEWVYNEEIKPQIIHYLKGELRKFWRGKDHLKPIMRIAKALYRLGGLFWTKYLHKHDHSEKHGKSPKEGSFGRYFNRRYHEALSLLVTFLSPDVVYNSFAWNAPLLDYCPESTVRILDIHDVQYLRPEIAKAAGGDLEDRRCSLREEIEMLEKANILIALEHRQVQELRKLCPTTEVVYCPHSPAVFESLGSPGLSRQLLFIGNLYDPNVRGLAAFLKDDWPTLREEGCELTVIGRVGEAFEPTRGVTFEGYVDNLRPFYSRAAIVLNLALYCTGLPIKTVEGLSLGKCVVSTPDAAKGLPQYPNIPVVQAKVGSMVDPILAFIRSTELRRKVESESFAYSRRFFSDEIGYVELSRALSKS